MHSQLLDVRMRPHEVGSVLAAVLAATSRPLTRVLEDLAGTKLAIRVLADGERPLRGPEAFRLGAAGIMRCRWRNGLLVTAEKDSQPFRVEEVDIEGVGARDATIVPNGGAPPNILLDGVMNGPAAYVGYACSLSEAVPTPAAAAANSGTPKCLGIILPPQQAKCAELRNKRLRA